MATIKFLLQSKSDNAPIYLRLSVNRSISLKRKTGLFINPKDWSVATGLPKQNTSSNKNLSTKLTGLSNGIIKRLNDANSQGITLNGDWLEDAIDLHFDLLLTSMLFDNNALPFPCPLIAHKQLQ